MRLRQKFEADPANPQLIRSVRGIGYSFNENVQQDSMCPEANAAVTQT
jgi:DNA-binding winged helix-turn-helix (wHTH) protein